MSSFDPVLSCFINLYNATSNCCIIQFERENEWNFLYLIKLVWWARKSKIWFSLNTRIVIKQSSNRRWSSLIKLFDAFSPSLTADSLLALLLKQCFILYIMFHTVSYMVHCYTYLECTVDNMNFKGVKTAAKISALTS